MLLGLFRSKTSLEAENLALRHQLNVLRRTSPRRPVFSNFDRMIFVCLYRTAPRILDALTIVEPETVIRWHRAGFRSFLRWKSRRPAGRPSLPPEIRRLIWEMSLANPLWGAPRIHGELLKLGIDIGQTSVAKYRRGEGDLRRKAGERSSATIWMGSPQSTSSWFQPSHSSYCTVS
jgi:hypothetical protein